MIEDYVAIDLEMTGLNAKRDSILEIGAVRVKQKKVVDTYQAMIHPHMELSDPDAQTSHFDSSPPVLKIHSQK